MTPLVELPQPYPLCWPAERPRAPKERREPDRYQAKSVIGAVTLLDVEIKRWRAPERPARIIAHELTSDPAPRGREDPSDPGAALWFTLGGKEITGRAGLMVLACDKFRRLAQNIRAIGLTMERLRLVDEIGAYSLVAAVEGARALPPPAGWGAPGGRHWREELQVMTNASLAVAEAAYRALARGAAGPPPNEPLLVRLNLAIEAARAELRQTSAPLIGSRGDG